MTFSEPVPILRSFDETSARSFYVDFLGFKVDWEHRFEPGLPLYMQLSLGDCVLHRLERVHDLSGVAQQPCQDALQGAARCQ